MDLIICLVIAIVIAACVLGVVRAALGLEPLSSLAPFGNLIYALIVLLVVLAVINYCLGGLVFQHHSLR